MNLIDFIVTRAVYALPDLAIWKKLDERGSWVSASEPGYLSSSPPQLLDAYAKHISATGKLRI
jgi:hypothetical protein